MSEAIARIDNNWPRAGVSGDSLHGRSLIGRFLANEERWAYSTNTALVDITGTGAPLGALAEIFARECSAGRATIMFGYIAFEAGFGLLGLNRPSHRRQDWASVPDMQFLVFANCDRRQAQESGRQVPAWQSFPRLLEQARVLTPRPDYDCHVEQVLSHIAEGDIYQANYTQGFDLLNGQSEADNYWSICRRCPASYNACLHFPAWPSPPIGTTIPATPEFTILSASPEQFWQKSGDAIVTRPIKGTIARADTEPEDEGQRRRLIESKKDCAELLMITDLERNDLGIVAQTGSVRTVSLMSAHPTPSVWHLESTVTARLQSELTWVDVMKATFPGGSISGAPKRRAMEILGRLEPVARGVYCGTFGWVDAQGDAEFAVAIRTAVQIGNRVRLFGGGGIVADSVPELEYQESLIKIAPLIEAFTSPTPNIAPPDAPILEAMRG